MFLKILYKLLPEHYRKQLTNFYILAHEYGQYKTIKQNCCEDKNKNPLPWYTYPAIEYLNSLDISQKNIFEYGAGNSSLYWADRANKVLSVEHNENWFKTIYANKKNNLTLVLKENKQEYINYIKEIGQTWDVIVIDGLYRKLCVEIISAYINKNGMIILDNSDWYKNSAKYIREKLGFIQVDFHGFTPINAYTSTTSIFLSRDFRFEPITEQPSFSIHAIEHDHDRKEL